MALTQVTGPYPIFTDLDGSPLDDGYLYIGSINEDPEVNPIQVYWDSALTIPAVQPIRTNNGYAWRNGTPALIYTAGEFSITIRNKRGEFVLYSPVGYGFDPAAVSASVVKNDFTGDGVTVDFTLSASPSTKLATSVFINGVYQEKDSYSILGNVLTFTVAPPLSASIEVMTNETGVIGTTNASLVSYTAGFAGAVLQTVQTKLEQYVSVKDFGAVGDGVTDDTAAIQAALDSSVRSILVPPGTYRITSSLNLNQDVFLEGCGGIQDPSDGGQISKIEADGNFDALVLKSSSYFGWLTLKNLYIAKTGGAANTNVGIKAAAFAPHVQIERCLVEGFDIGLDMFLGLANLVSVNSRFNNVGFRLKGTSFTVQDCYANRNVTGYRILEQTVYSSLLNCASDANTGNAYEFTGTTGPYTTQSDSANSYVTMTACGAEACGRYLYVNGDFDLNIAQPSSFNMTGTPTCVEIESARKVLFRNIGPGFGNLNWVDVNYAKCTVDVLQVEGDMPHFTNVSPPAATYTDVGAAVSGMKTLYGVIGLAKNRIPTFTEASSSGSVSTLEKGVFATTATLASKLRFRVEVMGNGNYYTARVRYSAFWTSGAGDAGGEIYMTVSNTGGINTSYLATSADITVAVSNGAVGGGPNGGTYYYFDVYSSRSYEYLWDVEAYTRFEVLRIDMVTNYNNWFVEKL